MKKSSKRTIGIGAGVLTAAAIAGAAAYMLSDSEAAKKGRAHAKAWVEQAKKEVVKNMKAAKRIGTAEYAELVEEAVKRYGSLKNASASEIVQAAREMKSEWKRIQAHAKKTSVKKTKKAKTSRGKKR